MNFKGTKGNWEFVNTELSDFKLITVISEKEVIAHINSEKSTRIANAKLISKAPELLQKLNESRIQLSQLRRSMSVHPDCTEGSEFDDFTNSSQELENEIQLLIKEIIEL